MESSAKKILKWSTPQSRKLQYLVKSLERNKRFSIFTLRGNEEESEDDQSVPFLNPVIFGIFSLLKRRGIFPSFAEKKKSLFLHLKKSILKCNLTLQEGKNYYQVGREHQFPLIKNGLAILQQIEVGRRIYKHLLQRFLENRWKYLKIKSLQWRGIFQLGQQITDHILSQTRIQKTLRSFNSISHSIRETDSSKR